MVARRALRRTSGAVAQEAKAAAMGPRRNRALLREVLAEPLLDVILDQVAQAQAAGWFWTYELNDAKAIPPFLVVSCVSTCGCLLTTPQ